MRRLAYAALAALPLLLAAAPARADGFITPYVGFNFGGDSANCATLTNCQDKRTNWGVSFGGTTGIIGFEEDIGYAKDFFGHSPTGDSSVLTVMSDLMILVPAGPIRPYVIGGIGLIHPHVQFSASDLSFDSNTLGWDLGGGLNLFLAPHVGVRGDVRHLHTFQDVTLGVFGNEKVDFWRASAGVTFSF
jgi:opacity protein-like surface antigen